MKKQIELGDEVKHILTGFKGVATAHTDYYSGCRRIHITPKVNKDGKLEDTMTFDEPEVEVTKKKKVKRKPDTGGLEAGNKTLLKINNMKKVLKFSTGSAHEN